MDIRRSSFALSRWLFLRLLGVVYLLAFLSLAVQIIGLVGARGILPADQYMTAARGWMSAQGVGGLERIRLLPTLCWLGTSDAFLRGLCAAGVALSVLLTLGLGSIAALPVLWVLYLSLSVIGREFMTYQWDALLLETGLLAMFIAPAVWRERPGEAANPPRLAVWLMWWLLFRLMVGSGAVKLTSGDPTWRGLTALTFHYETQPLPTPLAWYASHLPRWFHEMSTASVIAIELFTPWLIVAGRRARLAACALLIGLQALIAATGNYAFFNLLAVSLCVWFVDDRALEKLAALVRVKTPTSSKGDGAGFRRVALAAIVVIPVSLLAFTTSLGVFLPGWRVIVPVAEWLAPFRSINSYGLFAVMTTERDEIVVEGSNDGVTWLAYEFKYKPGDPGRAPPWVAPHQPRLDWQMWFAALDNYRNEAWFRAFCQRLLEGSPDVLALMARNPFGSDPPRYVRGSFYRYHFGDAAERARGQWWERTKIGEYAPVVP